MSTSSGSFRRRVDALGFPPSHLGRGSGLTYILDERLGALSKKLPVAERPHVGSHVCRKRHRMHASISNMMAFSVLR